MIVRELITLLGFKLEDGAQKKYAKQIEETKDKTNLLSGAVRGVSGAFQAFAAIAAGAGFIALGKSIIDATAQADRYSASLGILMGNQEKANKLVNEVSNLAVGNIYGDEAVLAGVQGLMQFGIAGDDAIDTIQRLGDIANGSGVALSSLGLNMGQVFAKGKADATDLKQFVLQGFDVVGIVSQQTGKSRAEIEKAGVSYEQTAAALKQLTSEGGKYYGMMDKISNTLGGLIGQLGALKDSIAMTIGLNVNDKLKDILRHILKIGRAMQDDLVSAGTRAFEAILTGIAQVIIFFKVIEMRMQKFGGAFTALEALFADVFGFLADVAMSATPFLLNLAQLILLSFKPIEAFVRPVLESLKPVFKDVFGFLAGILESLLPFVDALTPVFKQLGNSVASIITTAWGIISPFLDKAKKGGDPQSMIGGV
jgi:hypothetical protein